MQEVCLYHLLGALGAVLSSGERWPHAYYTQAPKDFAHPMGPMLCIINMTYRSSTALGLSCRGGQRVTAVDSMLSCAGFHSSLIGPKHEARRL